MRTPEILAHRGWWDRPEERNTLAALRRAFEAGLGVETDVRDCAGELVISHDPPRAGAVCLTLRDLLATYASCGCLGILAINIKADGLQTSFKSLLLELPSTQHFVFDMSVPDMLQWLNAGVPTFTRHSEHEPSPALFDKASGVWLDGFQRNWYSPDTLASHLAAGKQVAVVSPELHGRDPLPIWHMLKSIDYAKVMLCTDRIAEARRFFHE